MRSQLDMQLENLNTSLIEMGTLCKEAIESAIVALMNKDDSLAMKIIKNDEVINLKERDVEALCLKILLRQQPVAKDLRQVSSALKMITDMERIGDQAADIAEISLSHDFSIMEGITEIKTMADEAIAMVTKSIDAYVAQDVEMAFDVIRSDVKVNALFDQIKADILHQIHQNVDLGQEILDVLMIAKYLERIGDHATNIAEWVAFSVIGFHQESLSEY